MAIHTKVAADVDQVSKLDLSLTITMPISSWRQLLEQIQSNGWPAWEFTQSIEKSLTDMEQAFNRQRWSDED